LTYRPLKSEILSIKHPSSSTATTSPAVCINKSTRSDITIAHHHQRWSINQWTMVKCTYWINNIVEKEKNQNLRLAILFKIIEKYWTELQLYMNVRSKHFHWSKSLHKNEKKNLERGNRKLSVEAFRILCWTLELQHADGCTPSVN
jgi:hypothetical protein